VGMTEGGEPTIETIVEGDTVREVLSYVQYEPEKLTDRLRRQVEAAERKERLTPDEGRQLLDFYAIGLDGYTYLE